MGFLDSPHKIAGLLSLLAALLVLGMWYIFLFVATPSNISATNAAVGTLEYVLSSENPYRVYFVWLLVAPVIAIALGVAYLWGPPRSKGVATTMFVLSLALGLSAFYFANWSLGLFIALPSYWGFICIRNAAPPIRRDALKRAPYFKR
jgi:hypothetical protein